MILHEIFSVVSRFPRYILCYKAESRFPLGQCIMIRYFLLSIISDFSCSTFITCFMILILTISAMSNMFVIQFNLTFTLEHMHSFLALMHI